MGDHINKMFYLGLGVMLLVMALTSFFNSNQRLSRYNHINSVLKTNKNSWVKDVNRDHTNSLGLEITDSNLIKSGLVFNGEETKRQLLAMMSVEKGITIYKEGALVVESDYSDLYNRISVDEQLLLTYDHELNIVYIVTL